MTLDDFAVAIQHDLARMATKDDLKHMATKDDIRDMATKQDIRDIHKGMADIRADVKMVTDVMVSKADLEALREELLREIRAGKHIDELRERLAIVERKLGIAKNRAA